MDEEITRNEEVIRIQDVLNILKKRWKMIFLISLIAMLISAVASFFIIVPNYKTSTKVFIGKENTENQTYSNNDVEMYQKLLKTYAEVIMTNDLIQKAIDSNNLNITSSEVLKSLTVTPRSDTQILEIQYTNKNKILARDVLDSVTNQFIKSSAELINNGNIQIIESVKMPSIPSSPNKKMNIIIGTLIGLTVSLGIAFLLEFIDNTIKTKEQLEQVLKIPVIGVIPDDID